MITFPKLTEVPKKWGRELVIVNNDEYCGKILEFKAGTKFSSHFHLKKRETFYVLSGELIIRYFNLTNANELSEILKPGSIIDIPRGNPHQLIAIFDSRIVEFSTHHEDEDSYRIIKGDSQK